MCVGGERRHGCDLQHRVCVCVCDLHFLAVGTRVWLLGRGRGQHDSAG